MPKYAGLAPRDAIIAPLSRQHDNEPTRMSNVTRLPPHPKTARVEVEIPISKRDEFERAVVGIIAGERPRVDALDRDVAGVYNGRDYPFDLSELRGPDTALANACLDYLNYDRLGIKEVHAHLSNGETDLHRPLTKYRIEPAARP
jgi:hypothetical protein